MPFDKLMVTIMRIEIWELRMPFGRLRVTIMRIEIWELRVGK